MNGDFDEDEDPDFQPVASEMPRTLAVLAQMDKALADFDKAVDAEDELAGAVYAAVCTGILEQVRNAIRSGEILVREPPVPSESVEPRTTETVEQAK